ncbi:MAG TPA: hypothetical protein PKA19_06280 [Bacillota bacterium]|nr:hypothetical protein [Bacillota bacterium]
MKLYMGVTPDKFELPLAVCESVGELGAIFNTPKSIIFCEISRYKKGGRYQNDGRRRGVRFVSTEIEDEPEEEPSEEKQTDEENYIDTSWLFDRPGVKLQN